MRSRLEERIDVATAMTSVDVTTQQDGTWAAMTQHRRALFVAHIESLTTNGIATLTIREAEDTSGTGEQDLKSVQFTQTNAGFTVVTIEAAAESMATNKTQLRPRVNTDTTTTNAVLGDVTVHRGDGRYRPEDA